MQTLNLKFCEVGPEFVSAAASHIASGGQVPHFEDISFRPWSDFSSITCEEWKTFFDGVITNSSIKELELDKCHLGVAFIKGFTSATADIPETLEKLDLGGNDFGDVSEAEWAEFLNRLIKSNVETLVLGGCHLNSGVIKAFSVTPQNVRNKLEASSKSEKAVHLQQLNLSHNDFSALKEASSWARFLQTISELKVAKVRLASCNLPIDFAAALLDKKSDLQELDLADNGYFFQPES